MSSPIRILGNLPRRSRDSLWRFYRQPSIIPPSYNRHLLLDSDSDFDPVSNRHALHNSSRHTHDKSAFPSRHTTFCDENEGSKQRKFEGTGGIPTLTEYIPSYHERNADDHIISPYRSNTTTHTLLTLSPSILQSLRNIPTFAHPPSHSPFFRVQPHPSASNALFGYSSGYSTASQSSNLSGSGSQPVVRVVPLGGFLALNQIKDLEGSRKQKKRLGRGIGSGRGKTCGRGHKGQKSRTGRKPRIGFEGGQTPLRLRLPKRGFHNPFSMEFQAVNLGDLSRKIEKGEIDNTQLITMKTLRDTRLSGKAMRNGVKLLARGAEKLKVPIHIEVSRVSSEAKAAIEANGGSVTRVHYNKLGLRALLKPGWFTKKGRVLPRPARPPPKLRTRVDCIGRLPALPMVSLSSASSPSLSLLTAYPVYNPTSGESSRVSA